MKTIEEITEELYAEDAGAEHCALTMIRRLDYDDTLVLDHAAYREAVRAVLDAMERAREKRMADSRARLEAMKAERERARPA